MSLLVRLPHLCRDAAAAADIVAVRQCPSSDIACTRGTGCFVASFTPAADLAGVCHPRRQCFAEPTSVLRRQDRKSTRLNSSHTVISYAVFCLKKKKNTKT